MNGCALPAASIRREAKETLNRWIAHETARATREVTEAIEAYRFNDAAQCDLSLRLERLLRLVSRTRQAGADRARTGAAKAETRAMVAWARDEILKLLHPFMPFITEELWAVTASATACWC